MKNKLLLGAIATLGLLSLTGCGKSAEVDSKNILEMDEVKISAQEFFDDIKEEHIRDLIDKMDHQLLDKEYKETDEEDTYVEEQINTLKTTYANGDDKTFESILPTYFGVDSVKELEANIRIEYKREQAVNDYIEKNISDKEVENYYNTYTTGDVTASHILIKSDAKSTDSAEKQKEAEEKAKKEAEKIIKELDDGADFAELAKKYSDDKSTAENGGSLGTFSPDKMVEQFAAAVKELKVNEYTKKPVKTTYGYHIILKTGEEDKPELKDVEKDIREKIRKQKLESDQTLYYKSLKEFRESKGLKFGDSTMKKAYDDYMDSLIKNASGATSENNNQ